MKTKTTYTVLDGCDYPIAYPERSAKQAIKIAEEWLKWYSQPLNPITRPPYKLQKTVTITTECNLIYQNGKLVTKLASRIKKHSWKNFRQMVRNGMYIWANKDAVKDYEKIGYKLIKVRR